MAQPNTTIEAKPVTPMSTSRPVNTLESRSIMTSVHLRGTALDGLAAKELLAFRKSDNEDMADHRVERNGKCGGWRGSMLK